jgi:hypothetical protein
MSPAGSKKNKTTASRQAFDAVLESAVPGTEAACVSIPFDVEKSYGIRGRVPVEATFDGHPYRGVLSKMGSDCYCIGVRKDIRQAIGKKIGEAIRVTVRLATTARVLEIPPELGEILSRDKKVRAFFDALSFTNRKEYVVWILSARRPETKSSRLQLTLKKLREGKKNPSAK